MVFYQFNIVDAGTTGLWAQA